MKRKISYLGQTLETIHYDEDLSNEDYLEIIREIRSKPNVQLVDKQFKKIHKGGVIHNHITNYYFKNLMYDVKLYHSKWSINDVLNHIPLLRFFYNKTNTNKKVYPSTHSGAKKIETAFRLGGKGVASKPSNFPIKTVDYILENYNVNDNYHDSSCGWGVRLLSSLRNGVNYFGTDPNYKLCEELYNMDVRYKEVNNTKLTTEIRCKGSEIFIPEWENKMGLSFTSPPYFNLEDYKHGEQSWNENINYEMWLENFLRPTIKNIKKYLISGGYALMNINNFDEYELFNDTKNIFLEEGFEYIETINLENIKRTNSKGGHNDNSEGIMVFKKR